MIVGPFGFQFDLGVFDRFVALYAIDDLERPRFDFIGSHNFDDIRSGSGEHGFDPRNSCWNPRLQRMLELP